MRLCRSLPFLKETNLGKSNLCAPPKGTAASACLPQTKLWPPCPAYSPPADHPMQPAWKGPIILHDLLGLCLFEPAESCSSLAFPRFYLFSGLFLCPQNRARCRRDQEVIKRSELKVRRGESEHERKAKGRGPLKGSFWQ